VTDFALAGTVLTRDLVAATGKLVASRGEIVDVGYLKQLAGRAPKNGRQRALHETNVSEAVLEAFDAAPLQYLAGPPDARAQIADALCEVRFPDEVWQELEALREEDASRFQHAVWTAVVAARLFRAALGEAPGLSRLIGGALVHDIGMRHAAQRLRFKRDHLTANEALTLEDHPIVGALVHASGLRVSAHRREAAAARARPGLGGERVRGPGLPASVPAAAVQCPRRGRPALRRSQRGLLRCSRGAPAHPLHARGERFDDRLEASPHVHRLPPGPQPPRRLPPGFPSRRLAYQAGQRPDRQ